MLSSAQLNDFHTHGFLILRRAADPAFCQSVIAYAEHELESAHGPLELEVDTAYPGAPSAVDAAGGHTVRRLLQAYARAPMLQQWADTALSGPLQQLLGPGVMLSQAHHNCIMTKQPRYSSLTGWHRDSRYWHFARAELVSTWLALRDETLENGCLSVIPGSQRWELAAEQTDAAQFLRSDFACNQPLLAQAHTVPLQQGDVLLFHSNLFHAAGRNQTAATKFSLVFTYRAHDNLPVVGSRSASLPEIPLFEKAGIVGGPTA